MRRLAWTAALLAVGLTAACTSSGSPSRSSSGPPTSPPAPLSTPPTSPAPTSSAPTSSSAKPTPPLSKFEGDVAVKALRAWTAEVARTINSGEYDSPALNKLMTAQLAKTMKNLAGPEVGRHYPGPLPFTPITVSAVSGTSRDVHICFIDRGFSTKAGKKLKFHVQAADAGAVQEHGTWLVSKFDTGSFSCKGVKVKEVKW